MDVPLTGMYLRTSHKSASYMGVMTALRGKGIDYVKYLTTFEKSTRTTMTDGGRLGLAPSVSKPGDVVAIIKGARAPFILRPNQCGFVYKIIGQVYIRSLMFGEALETKDFNFKEIEITQCCEIDEFSQVLREYARS